jgi:hypothetical protein
MHHKHIEQRRDAQPHEPVAEELAAALAVERLRDEVAGNQKQESHEERLQPRLEIGEE